MLGVVTGAPGLNRAQWPCQMTSYPEVTAPHLVVARPQPADLPHPSPLGLLAQRSSLPSSASCRQDHPCCAQASACLSEGALPPTSENYTVSVKGAMWLQM